jgi:hypothetical protein
MPYEVGPNGLPWQLLYFSLASLTTHNWQLTTTNEQPTPSHKFSSYPLYNK